MSEIDHPEHYGGADNPYEAIKVIEAHTLDFNLGNAVKYILRSRHKGAYKEDLKKAVWYLERAISTAVDVDQYVSTLPKTTKVRRHKS